MNLPFIPDFSGKVAVVTGGAGVLCTDFCIALAHCGAKVAILDLFEDKAKALASELVSQGWTAIGVKANVLDRESLIQAHQTVMEAFGPCDILINGAGGNNPKATTTEEFFDKSQMGVEGKKSFFDLDLDGFQFVFGLNFTGTLLPTQIFAKDMIDRPGSVILNISSMNAFRPLTKIPAYSAAKAAISNFTQWLAVHFAKSGIRVNAMAPGFFSTTQNAALLWNPDGTPTARTGKILNATPMGRMGEPDELLGTLLWLLDNRSSGFVTGVVIPVDGGFSAYSGV
ncbi:MAG TPA: SDR family oxidoreductase [Candidatus Izemoplasmatales bacterium]|nr:SDR family oxidoreductase [Bacillota bacterium]HRY77661.1 SDR family oxidoreductase [Candidatus Izemoplasmatales bacterium]